MILDERIISKSIIYDCFETKEAEQYKGENGYFTNNFQDFANLNKTAYGTLREIATNNYSEKPYYNDKDNIQYAYFLPEQYVNQEKKFRSFTIEEFRQKFTIGQPIRYRHKENNVFENETLFMGFEKLHEEDYHGSITTLVLIGHSSYDLDELFKHCEYKDAQGNWVSFGVVDE